jgi:hypothetical protein
MLSASFHWRFSVERFVCRCLAAAGLLLSLSPGHCGPAIESGSSNISLLVPVFADASGGSATRQLPATAEDVVRPVAQGNSVEAVFAPPLREPSWLPLSTPVTIRAFAGDNYAEPSAFGTIEFFKPLNSWQFTSGDEQVEYLNTRAALSREGGGLINLGYGRRHYFADSDIIVDGNA